MRRRFYGPKLDIQIKNVHGKEDTLITIQIDQMLAELFGMEYVDVDGKMRRPYIIHRTSMGCYEPPSPCCWRSMPAPCRCGWHPSRYGCFSEIGSTRICSGASHIGMVPAYFSSSRARVRS